MDINYDVEEAEEGEAEKESEIKMLSAARLAANSFRKDFDAILKRFIRLWEYTFRNT